MKKIKLSLLILALLLISGISSANATTLTFDDLGIGQITNYGGFNWLNMYVKNQPVNAVSGSQVAYDGFGLPAAITRNELFDFNSTYLSAFNNDDLMLTVLGFNVNISSNLLNSISSLTPKYSRTISLIEDVPTLYTFNYEDINAIAFITYDQKNPITISLGNNKFAMDNFTFNEANPPVPEPSSILFGILGLGGLLSNKRRK